ncbi:hypothetical protein U1Q18_023814 [Sarracenia purpurea var. burkii]
MAHHANIVKHHHCRRTHLLDAPRAAPVSSADLLRDLGVKDMVGVAARFINGYFVGVDGSLNSKQIRRFSLNVVCSS